jgi:hypothetical protein
MTETERLLVTALADEARGPRRNALFALWLVTRVAEAVMPPDPVSVRAHRRRVDRLQRRLTSVSVPAPLRRALPAAFRHLADGTPRAVALGLHQLVAPARESIGPSIADILVAAAERARHQATEVEAT